MGLVYRDTWIVVNSITTDFSEESSDQRVRCYNSVGQARLIYSYSQLCYTSLVCDILNACQNR